MANILYSDIHAKNLLVNPQNLDIKLIDFDPTYVKFEFYKSKYEDMIRNLLILLKTISNKFNLNIKYDKINSLEQIEQKVLCLSKKKKLN